MQNETEKPERGTNPSPGNSNRRDAKQTQWSAMSSFRWEFRFDPWVVALFIIFAASRFTYMWAGVRFDAEPLNFYWQIIDPKLLRTDLWRSIFYLQEQLPGFNLFLGLGLKTFASHYWFGFLICYTLFGLILTFSLFFLLVRLGVRSPIAFVVTVLFAVNPATVLYENILFYEYPIAAVFSLAALLCHRYLSNRTSLDGVLLFICLTVLGYLRVIYHFAWMIMMIALIAIMARRYWRQTLWCALLPTLALGLLYAKNLIVSGTLVPGNNFFGGANILYMATKGLLPGELETFRDRGIISNAFFVQFDDAALMKIVPLPPPTGITLLDQRQKSTGAMNNLGLWKGLVGRQFRKDGIAILRERPVAIFRTIGYNLERSVRLADERFPFDGRNEGNMTRIQHARTLYHRIVAGYIVSNRPVFVIAVIPILLLFGTSITLRAASSLWKGAQVPAEDGTLVFCTLAILWLYATVNLYSYADQNRYMFEVSPLMVVLAGALLERISHRGLRHLSVRWMQLRRRNEHEDRVGIENEARNTPAGAPMA